MKTHVKALVVGGGAVGNGIAYHLAKAGWDTMLVERDELTSGSTWHAAANIHGLHDNTNISRLQHYTMSLYEQLEAETVQWCREMLANSPIALRCLKAALNADCDGQAGLQELAGNATLLYYLSEEGQEGKNAYLEKRKPDFRKFPRFP